MGIKLIQHYVIVTRNNRGLELFYAHDKPSGYPYMASWLGNAKQFRSYEDALFTVDQEFVNAPLRTLSDGAIHPAALVQEAAHVNKLHPNGSITVQVFGVGIVEASMAYEIPVQIKQCDAKAKALAKLTHEDKVALGLIK